jgi:hypothetical protein
MHGAKLLCYQHRQPIAGTGTANVGQTVIPQSVGGRVPSATLRIYHSSVLSHGSDSLQFSRYTVGR